MADNWHPKPVRLCGYFAFYEPGQRCVHLNERGAHIFPIPHVFAPLLFVRNLEKRVTPKRHQPFENVTAGEVAWNWKVCGIRAVSQYVDHIQPASGIADRGDAVSN